MEPVRKFHKLIIPTISNFNNSKNRLPNEVQQPHPTLRQRLRNPMWSPEWVQQPRFIFTAPGARGFGNRGSYLEFQVHFRVAEPRFKLAPTIRNDPIFDSRSTSGSRPRPIWSKLAPKNLKKQKCLRFRVAEPVNGVRQPCRGSFPFEKSIVGAVESIRNISKTRDYQLSIE